MRANIGLFSRFFIVAGLALCHARANPGGFTVKVEPTIHFTRVVDEAVDARITIRNLTGRPYDTAAGDRFTCEVEYLDARDRAVLRYADAKLPDVKLQPGETWQGTVRLTDMFKMREEGDYFVRARAANSLGSGESEGTIITLAAGTPLKQARQMFSDGTQREFRLVTLKNYQVCEYLYLRIIDPDNARAWETLRLDVVFRSEEPKLDIQDDGTVTVIHRATRELHMKTTLASSHEGVRLVSREELLDPEALSQLLFAPFIEKAAEPPPPPKKPWYRFW
ncbi:MAG: hypothetical protein FWF96_05885 [Kiritimatiellaeota bacterium]|nr:hypothetical protein [Kiritimatiellota bacterium]